MPTPGQVLSASPQPLQRPTSATPDPDPVAVADARLTVSLSVSLIFIFLTAINANKFYSRKWENVGK